MQYDVIEMYVTNECQISCSGCGLHTGTSSLTVEQVKRIYNSGILGRTRAISILGGEPTLWPYLQDFIMLCRDVNPNISIEMTTNGINITEDVMTCCKDNNVSVNVSYHGIKDVVETLVNLKNFNILQKIILVPSMDNVDKLADVYSVLSGIGKCVIRPYIGGEEQKNIVKFLNTKLKNMHLPMESSLRRVNREMKSNIDIIINAAQDKNFYRNYRCKCGKNGVIYTDGKLYHCLSQAMKSYKPVSMKLKDEVTWLPCNFDYCCCDTFQIVDKDKK